MTEGWVVFAYTVVYGFIVGYAASLVSRWRKLGK